MTRLWRWQTNQVSVTETFSLGIKDIISPKSEKRTLTLPTSIDLDNLYENYHLILFVCESNWKSDGLELSKIQHFKRTFKTQCKIKNNYSSPHPPPWLLSRTSSTREALRTGRTVFLFTIVLWLGLHTRAWAVKHMSRCVLTPNAAILGCKIGSQNKRTLGVTLPIYIICTSSYFTVCCVVCRSWW